LTSLFIVRAKVQSMKELNNLELLNELMIQAATLHLPIFALCDSDNKLFFG
jgi:hypothetical protein